MAAQAASWYKLNGDSACQGFLCDINHKNNVDEFLFLCSK